MKIEHNPIHVEHSTNKKQDLKCVNSDSNNNISAERDFPYIKNQKLIEGNILFFNYEN